MTAAAAAASIHAQAIQLLMWVSEPQQALHSLLAHRPAPLSTHHIAVPATSGALVGVRTPEAFVTTPPLSATAPVSLPSAPLSRACHPSEMTALGAPLADLCASARPQQPATSSPRPRPVPPFSRFSAPVRHVRPRRVRPRMGQRAPDRAGHADAASLSGQLAL
eukprot:3249070-Prymnesium_polylepis.1